MTELIGGDGKANDVEVIRFLKAKAREGRIWSLLSGTLLEEARSELYASGSSAKANENILQSAYVNMMHGLTDMMPSTLMFQAAACERLNLNDWANKVFHSLSILHGGHLSLTDRISAISRLSHYLSLSGQYGRAEKLFDEAAEGVQGVLKLQQKLQGFRGIVAVRKYLHRSVAPIVMEGHECDKVPFDILTSFTQEHILTESNADKNLQRRFGSCQLYS